jgi:hypothetical protein
VRILSLKFLFYSWDRKFDLEFLRTHECGMTRAMIREIRNGIWHHPALQVSYDIVDLLAGSLRRDGNI